MQNKITRKKNQQNIAIGDYREEIQKAKGNLNAI